jgi:uncharacterized protein YdhG (YjbR/CyaY superfamily)
VATRTAKRPAPKAKRVRTVDDYLAAAPKERRAALTKMRETIKAAAPKAGEEISYGLVGYKLNGKYLVYFGNWKAHVALYGTSHEFIKAHPAELRNYVQTKGTIRFPADKPIPLGLVTRIVKARIAEIENAPT